MKARKFNIVLISILIVALWLSNTLIENKIVLTILFSTILGFWIVSKKDAIKIDEKNEAIKELLKHGIVK